MDKGVHAKPLESCSVLDILKPPVRHEIGWKKMLEYYFQDVFEKKLSTRREEC